MSGTNYKSSNSRDLFAVDDVEDEAFLKHPRSGSSGYILSNSQESRQLEEKRQDLLERKRAIEERTLMSTERSLDYLRNSEEVGIAAAEELLRQREQLERTERSLDNINTTLRFTQKHIQGIKSVFGGLKNFFGNKLNENLPEGGLPRNRDGCVSSHQSPLSDAINDITSPEKRPSANDDHIGLQIRGLGVQDRVPVTHQERIDKNLDEMLGTVTKLKGLAHGLGEEIETHNVIIGNVLTKTERADDSLRRQNKDIKRLL